MIDKTVSIYILAHTMGGFPEKMWYFRNPVATEKVRIYHNQIEQRRFLRALAVPNGATLGVGLYLMTQPNEVVQNAGAIIFALSFIAGLAGMTKSHQLKERILRQRVNRL